MSVLRAGKVDPVKLPVRSPNLNACAERLVRSIKSECLSKIIVPSKKVLRAISGSNTFISVVQSADFEQRDNAFADRVSIADEKSHVGFPGESFYELLSGPLSSWMRRDAEMQDPATREIEHYEHEEQLEPDRPDDGEVDGDRLVEMVSQKCSPALTRSSAGQGGDVIGYGRFADVDPKHEKLTMNPWCAPERILAMHPQNPLADFLPDPRATAARPALPTPESAEPFAMPAEHSSRLNNENGVTPAGPEPGRDDQQTSIGSGELKPLAAEPSPKDCDLVAQDDDLGFERKKPETETGRGRPRRASAASRRSLPSSHGNVNEAVWIRFLGGTTGL